MAESIEDLDAQIQALEAQKALLAQRQAEDPQRSSSRDDVAEVVAEQPFWASTVGLQVSTALHPDWVTLDIPLDGIGALERAARLQLVEQLVHLGAEHGYTAERREVPGRVLLHREWAASTLQRVAEEYGW